MTFDASWLVLAFFVVWALLKLPMPPSVFSFESIQAQTTRAKAKIPRPLKPRSADDCCLCREAKRKPTKPVKQGPPVRPWREHKSHRGRPKQISTEGFACSYKLCEYFGIKDQLFHTLVGDGKAGKTESDFQMSGL